MLQTSQEKAIEFARLGSFVCYTFECSCQLQLK